MHSVLAHRANRKPVAAVADIPVLVARVEVDVGVGRAALVERRRPEVAARTLVVQPCAPTVARSGQENSASVRSREQSPLHTVLCCPP